MAYQFLAIGDTTVDEFIRLHEAHVERLTNSDEETITMNWGDKIPYEWSLLVPAVGNAANAAVAAARLGLSSGFLSNVGNDRYGEEVLATFKQEGVDTRFIAVNQGIPTNHHYVLSYQTERTILIRHEAYPYIIPKDLEAPAWIYLSSAGEHSAGFHDDLAVWLDAHPETKLAFQPGTFQMEMGKEKLARLYARSEIVAINKEEAERILGVGQTDIKELLEKMRSLGPKIALITDGRAGAYAMSDEGAWHIPMFPDPKPPVERTGAGDASTSTTVAYLALGFPLTEAIMRGLINSMSVVQEVGAQKGLLHRDQIEEWYAKRPAEFVATPL